MLNFALSKVNICSMTTSIIFILMTIISISSYNEHMVHARELKCNEFDDLFNDITVVSSPRRLFPKNSVEFNEYCKRSTELANEIGQLIKTCFNDTMRNVASVMLYSYRSRAKTLCKNRNSKRVKNLMEAAPCLNQYKAKISKCIDMTANKIGEAKNKPNNLKFPHLCCESVNFEKCIDKIQAGECKEKVMIFANTANTVVSGFIDGSCGEYNRETDRCEQLGPITVKQEKTKPSLARNAAELLASIDP